MGNNSAKKQFKAYKQSLKDDIFDLSEKVWSFISFVNYQYKTRDYGIVQATTAEVFNWEEWA